jgi:hypothetical protein
LTAINNENCSEIGIKISSSKGSEIGIKIDNVYCYSLVEINNEIGGENKIDSESAMCSFSLWGK